MPMVVTLCTFLAIVIMSHKQVRGAVLIGILGGMGLYYLLGLTVDGFYAQLQIQFVSPFEAFDQFTTQSLLKVVTEGFDFSAYTAQHGGANLILTIVTTALAFCMVDMFDTLGTLYAACERAGLMDEKGEPLNMNQGSCPMLLPPPQALCAAPPPLLPSVRSMPVWQPADGLV